MFRKRFWLVAGLMVVLLGAVSFSVLAQTGGGSTEALPESAQPGPASVIGDDPDEDGYQGADAPPAAVFPSENGVSALGADFSLEGEPDSPGYTGDAVPSSGDVPFTEPPAAPNLKFPSLENEPDVIGSEANETGTRWTDFFYSFVAGSTMLPRDSSTTWSYGGYGCVVVPSGGNYLIQHLDIPSGARIDYLRIFYYDTSSSDSTAWITSYDAQGNHDDMISVSSSGTGGYDTALSDYLGEVVDTFNNSYVLLYIPDDNTSNMKLCGLRVAYRLP